MSHYCCNLYRAFEIYWKLCERHNLHNEMFFFFLYWKWNLSLFVWKGQERMVGRSLGDICSTKMIRCQRVINHISSSTFYNKHRRLLFQWPVLRLTMAISHRSLWERRWFHNEIKRNDIYRLWIDRLGIFSDFYWSLLLRGWVGRNQQKNHHVMNINKWMFDAVKLTFINGICCK